MSIFRRLAFLALPALGLVTTSLGQELLEARHWQLFIDDYAVARGTGFDRVVHHPRAMGVVVPADQPWETHGICPTYFARKADGTFVGYYDAVWWAPGSGARSSDSGDMEYFAGAWRRKPNGEKRPPDRAQEYAGARAYVTSRDGIHWEKPNLGLEEAPTATDLKKYSPLPAPLGASKANNLGVPYSFIDLGQYGNVSDPAKRFALSADGHAYFAAELPDFIHDPHWRAKLTDAGGTFSPRGHMLHFWDASHQEWVAITQNTTPHWLPGRTIARFASADLKTWRSELVLAADSADPHSPTWYDEPMVMVPFCAEGVVFGLLSWVHTDRTTPDGGPVMAGARAGGGGGWPWPVTPQNPTAWPWARKGVDEQRITLSRDGGHTWDRTSSREAWIPFGTEEDSYDRMVIWCAPPVRVEDEDWFYTGVINGNHLSTRSDAAQRPYYHDRMQRCEIALHRQKHNRYVSLRTGSQRETLITRPFVVTGDTLRLNVDASRGAVRVGIAEYKPVATLGKALPGGGRSGATLSTDPYLMEQNGLPGFSREDCRPIEANGINVAVEFKQGPSLQTLRGRTVVLFIEAVDSDLYGFRVE